MKKTSRRNFLKGLAAAPVVAAEIIAHNPFEDADGDTDSMKQAKAIARSQHDKPPPPETHFQVMGTAVWPMYASAVPWPSTGDRA